MLVLDSTSLPAFFDFAALLFVRKSRMAEFRSFGASEQRLRSLRNSDLGRFDVATRLASRSTYHLWVSFRIKKLGISIRRFTNLDLIKIIPVNESEYKQLTSTYHHLWAFGFMLGDPITTTRSFGSSEKSPKLRPNRQTGCLSSDSCSANHKVLRTESMASRGGSFSQRSFCAGKAVRT